LITRHINRQGLVIGAAVLAIAFAHPATAEIPGINVAPVAQLSATVYPRSLAAAPDGTIWFSEEKLPPHSIGFFTPDGRVTKFAVPCDQCDGNGTRLAYIESITVGPDGNLWFLYSYVNGDGAPLGGMNNFLSADARRPDRLRAFRSSPSMHSDDLLTDNSATRRLLPAPTAMFGSRRISAEKSGRSRPLV